MTRMSATVAPSTLSRTAPCSARGDDRQRQGQDQRDTAHEEAGPVRLVRPDAEGLEERGTEDAGGRGGHEGVEDVGAHEAEARDGTGSGTERGAREHVDRAGVPVVLAEPDEDVGDEQDGDGGEEEGQRRGPADLPGRALRVDVGGHARCHQGDGDADRLPDRETAAKGGALLGCGGHCTLLPGVVPTSRQSRHAPILCPPAPPHTRIPRPLEDACGPGRPGPAS